MDFLDPQAYVGLREAVDDELPLVAYFATPASVFGGICENLAAAGLAERTRVVLEKPIGHDLSRPARSTRQSPGSSRKAASTGSTITWARRRCRT